MRLDPSPRALVLSTGRNSAWIAVDGESEPRLAQLRRASGKRSMPVPGDVVTLGVLSDEHTVIDRIEPRSSTLARSVPGGRSKIMAANVDALAIVVALAHPAPRLATLDQLLAFAEFHDIAPIVVFTKPDLAPPEIVEGLSGLYAGLGYPTIAANPKRNENLDPLRDFLRTRRAMLAGNSGVGKSSIFRALGGPAAVGEVSRHGLGRQTTTTARLFRIGDGFLIDSPGVNEFGLGEIPSGELAAGFPEIAAAARECRFGDCSHLQEPGCAVLAGVAQGRIAAGRHASYAKLLAAGGGPAH